MSTPTHAVKALPYEHLVRYAKSPYFVTERRYALRPEPTSLAHAVWENERRRQKKEFLRAWITRRRKKAAA